MTRPATTIAAAALLLAGCTSHVGTKVDEQQTTAFKEGVTPCSEIVATLGKPWRTFSTPGGIVSRLHYDYAVGTATPESAIPVVGMFVAGTRIQSTRHDFFCDANGIFIRHTVEYADQVRPEGIANRK
jgi:hypothetical protein